MKLWLCGGYCDLEKHYTLKTGLDNTGVKKKNTTLSKYRNVRFEL